MASYTSVIEEPMSGWLSKLAKALVPSPVRKVAVVAVKQIAAKSADPKAVAAANKQIGEFKAADKIAWTGAAITGGVAAAIIAAPLIAAVAPKLIPLAIGSAKKTVIAEVNDRLSPTEKATLAQEQVNAGIIPTPIQDTSSTQVMIPVSGKQGNNNLIIAGVAGLAVLTVFVLMARR